ncbi:hypothetical protein [Parvularcula dongshanensis]|uniref:Uncharacterized protein n=1 Tax=Parvularcula dongshanensis TaxID=1173995 RepID=A0A840I3U1_9PROT|nr:hypothetical protein [Parvularcula dongshanensis]MBB4658941.1 hypothetical protein [Parvularcula dongshanensis]
MTEQTDASEDPAEAIRAVIRATVSASGEPDPSVLPNLVRAQLRGHDTAGHDVDAYIREVLAEMRDA